MLITQDTNNKTRNVELGGGSESGDGGDYVMGLRSWRSRSLRKVVEHTAVDGTKLEACWEKSWKIKRWSASYFPPSALLSP